MGRSVRGTSEIENAVFGLEGKIIDVTTSAKTGQIVTIQWMPAGCVVAQRSNAEHVDLLPALEKKLSLKTGKLSVGDRTELRLRLGSDLPVDLKSHANLSDTEMIMGAWIFHRDLVKDRLKMAEQPYFCCPQIVANAVDPEIIAELRGTAGEVLNAYYRSRGLVGPRSSQDSIGHYLW